MPRRLGRVLLQALLTAALAALLSGVFAAQRTRLDQAAAQNAPLPGMPIRLVSYNIRVDTVTDGENAWPQRRDNVAAVLRFHHADVVCVQEAYLGMATDLAERLPQMAWYGLGTEDGDGRGACNAVFYQRRRFRLVQADTSWLSGTPEVPSRGWDAAFARACTHVELLDLYTGRNLHVLNVHLDHEGAKARTESARLLARRVSALEGDVVLAGDLNCTRQEMPWRVLCDAGLRDARLASQTGHFGLNTTFNDFSARWHDDLTIDFIFVSAGLAVTQEGTPCTLFGCRHASDHFPVIADLQG
ncbi:MAG: endonuclease/exonuclease/phosphatase family protein [Planctomycetes bacterium]|nr:endonuclease/exonuclease/phosphatase family protein [Planctomycetota bacterium]